MGDKATAQNLWITELNDNDVQLGRGAVILKTPGHVRFRRLVQESRPEYTASSKHIVKQEIAERIMNTIGGRGGRFVRKVETVAEKEKLGAPLELQDVYVVVDEDAVIQKIKQALREPASSKSPAKTRKRKASHSDLSIAPQHQPASLTVRELEPTLMAAAVLPKTTVTAAPPPSAQDLEFRLKHPSLRKRDLSRLRRQQHIFAEGSSMPTSIDSLQLTMSEPLFPASRPTPSDRNQEKEDDTDSFAEESKPKAMDKHPKDNEG